MRLLVAMETKSTLNMVLPGMQFTPILGVGEDEKNAYYNLSIYPICLWFNLDPFVIRVSELI